MKGSILRSGNMLNQLIVLLALFPTSLTLSVCNLMYLDSSYYHICAKCALALSSNIVIKQILQSFYISVYLYLRLEVRGLEVICSQPISIFLHVPIHFSTTLLSQPYCAPTPLNLWSSLALVSPLCPFPFFSPIHFLSPPCLCFLSACISVKVMFYSSICWLAQPL